MSRSRRQAGALILFLTMSSLLPERVWAGEAPRVLRLQVSEYVGLPEGALARAQEQVDRIFGRVGVVPVWVDSEVCGDNPALSSCRPWIRLHILPRSFAVWDTSVMGLADNEAGLGPTAYIFYDRLRCLVERHTPEHQRRSTIAVALGHVIAHELGHLLLPTVNDHSPVGVMQARWASDELHDARKGRLGFTGEQARLIRTELDGRLHDYSARTETVPSAASLIGPH